MSKKEKEAVATFRWHTLSIDELDAVRLKVNEFAWQVLDKLPKDRTPTDNAVLEICRKAWININNETCSRLSKSYRK